MSSMILQLICLLIFVSVFLVTAKPFDILELEEFADESHPYHVVVRPIQYQNYQDFQQQYFGQQDFQRQHQNSEHQNQDLNQSQDFRQHNQGLQHNKDFQQQNQLHHDDRSESVPRPRFAPRNHGNDHPLSPEATHHHPMANDHLPSGDHQHSGDLKPAETGYGHDTSGWLDMGAYSGGYGAFGWYADYPVGGGHGYGR